MRAAVIYESMFGNTAKIAASVGEGLRDSGAEVEVIPVSRAGERAFTSFDLVVVGAPTHAFGLSRPATRAQAIKQGAPPESARTGVREWLAALPDEGTATAATFDTRASSMRRWPGSAARGLRRHLRRAGHHLAVRPQSFYVGGTDGPLDDGEEDRARAWGSELARNCAHPA